MGKKRVLMTAAVVISLAAVALYFVYLYSTKKNMPRLTSTSEVLAHVIVNHGSLKSLLDPVEKIRLSVPDTLVLDNDLFRMTAYCDSLLVIVNKIERQIWIVNNEGKILKVVGKVGGGPGEFRGITCFAVSPDRSIYVYDFLQQRFTVFDFNGTLLKVFKLTAPGIQIRHIAIDKNQMIFVHHPPSKEYPAFISVFDSNGNFVKNLRTNVDWNYTNYYRRGFLDGDLMITKNECIIESNDFSYRMYVGDVTNKFEAVGEKPSDYRNPPVIENDSPEEYIRAAQKLATPLFFISYQDSVFFQCYVSAEDKARGSIGVLRAIDMSGNYLGEVSMNINPFPNLGDPTYVVSLVPRMENGRWNQRVPYDFVIYRWKSLPELQAHKSKSVSIDTVRKITELQELGALENIKAIGFVSQQDCETCDEVLVSELNQLKLKLRDKSKSVVLAIINSDNQFLEDLKLRYGNLLDIVQISRPVSLTSPSVFLNNNGEYVHLAISPNNSSFMEFTHRIDSVISAIR